MPDFIADQTLERIAALTRDLDRANTELAEAVNALRDSSTPAQESVTAQAFVERVLALDEQLSRARLLLPLCTTGVMVNEGNRTLALSDILAETRSEFDTLARAQLELLIQGAEG